MKPESFEKTTLLQQHFIWALGLLFLNILSKSLFLGSPDIGLDEPFTLFRAQKSYAELINDLANNNHPPLFESLVWVWLRIVGFKTAALRILPMLLSSAAALSIFYLGKKHFSLYVGVVAALLFSFSNYHFYLSHELRSYPLFALVTTLNLNYYLGLIQGEKQKKHSWIIQGMLQALLLYTHYFGAFVILSQLAHSLFVLRNRAMVVAQLKAGILTAALYVPQVWMVLDRWVDKVEGGHWLQSPSIPELFNVLSKFMNAPVLTVGALILGGVGGYFALQGKFKSKVSAVLFLFPLSFVLMWCVAQFLPIFQDRYISFTTIAWFLFTAIALDQLPKWPKLLMAISLVVLMATTVSYQPNNGQWTKELTQVMKEHKGEHTDVYVYPHWSIPCFSFHYDIGYFSDYLHTEELLQKDGIHFIHSKDDPVVAQSLENGSDVILINFEGPISEKAKDFGHLNIQIIEKDRQGLVVIRP